MRTQPRRGSHLPVLMKLIRSTWGPVLELGSGIYSTGFLHWACYPTKRRLVTYEANTDWYNFAKQFEDDFHEVHCISSYDDMDPTPDWSIAFVDHAPDGRRVEDIKRLAHSDFVVAHDAENKNDRKYRYSTIYRLFKYRWKYSEPIIHTIVFSNKHDLSHFAV